eukprot:gene9006-biopygen2134
MVAAPATALLEVISPNDSRAVLLGIVGVVRVGWTSELIDHSQSGVEAVAAAVGGAAADDPVGQRSGHIAG